MFAIIFPLNIHIYIQGVLQDVVENEVDDSKWQNTTKLKSNEVAVGALVFIY